MDPFLPYWGAQDIRWSISFCKALVSSADSYVLVQGTALYGLQSCMNHSDTPNAWAMKDDDAVDGRTVISATRSICKGEEICISYVGSEASESERAAALRDYGVTSTYI
jgi:hypothetical protein